MPAKVIPFKNGKANAPQLSLPLNGQTEAQNYIRNASMSDLESAAENLRSALSSKSIIWPNAENELKEDPRFDATRNLCRIYMHQYELALEKRGPYDQYLKKVQELNLGLSDIQQFHISLLIDDAAGRSGTSFMARSIRAIESGDNTAAESHFSSYKLMEDQFGPSIIMLSPKIIIHTGMLKLAEYIIKRDFEEAESLLVMLYKMMNFGDEHRSKR